MISGKSNATPSLTFTVKPAEMFESEDKGLTIISVFSTSNNIYTQGNTSAKQ